MPSREELIKRIEVTFENRRLKKLAGQNSVPKKKTPKRKYKLQKLKKVCTTYQSDIEGLYVNVAEAEENERKEKEVLDSIVTTVDKRTSQTKESCYLRNN